jgi:hypothetical protein
MGRPSKGPRAMTDAERAAASRARKKLASTTKTKAPAAASPKASPKRRVVTVEDVAEPVKASKRTSPDPIGATLLERETFAALMKQRAERPEASAQDVATYDRALSSLAELRGETGEMTESSMARSPVFVRWVRRLLDAVEDIPGAFEALKAELSK